MTAIPQATVPILWNIMSLTTMNILVPIMNCAFYQAHIIISLRMYIILLLNCYCYISTLFQYIVNIALFQIRLQPIGNCEEWTVSHSCSSMALYVHACY